MDEHILLGAGVCKILAMAKRDEWFGAWELIMQDSVTGEVFRLRSVASAEKPDYEINDLVRIHVSLEKRPT